MPYPENFAVCLIICILGMTALWMAAHYLGVVLIRHEAFTVGPLDFAIPVALGVFQAYTWKPKEKK